VLARLVGGDEDVGVAAAEALGKTGTPAVAFLASLARADSTRRLRAYGALGMIRTDEAYACLANALERDRELGDVIARALAQHGRREAIEPLYQRSRQAPCWMRRHFEAAIAALVHGAPAPDPVELDWRLRYRRLPRLDWHYPVSWMTLAGLRRRRRRLSEPSASPRSIAEIAADPSLHPTGAACPVCGGAFWRPTGVPVCRHSAREVVTLQIRTLRCWLALGLHDVWQALDECDALEARVSRPHPTDAALDVVAVARATLYWLVAIDCEDIRTGAHHLRVIADDFSGAYRKRVAPRDSKLAVGRSGNFLVTAISTPHRRHRPPNFS